WQRPTTPIKESGHMLVDYAELCAERIEADAKIEDWARRVEDAYLARDMTSFSAAAQREVSAPYRLLVTHFFNHQTHHRGQAHALITAAGPAFFAPLRVRARARVRGKKLRLLSAPSLSIRGGILSWQFPSRTFGTAPGPAHN